MPECWCGHEQDDHVSGEGWKICYPCQEVVEKNWVQPTEEPSVIIAHDFEPVK